MSAKAWLSAMRLRTLPLSLSSIILATFIAAADGVFDGITFTLALATTVLLQILSNLANDYGDGVKGTDNAERLGPKRAVQSGVITVAQMKIGVILFSVLSFASGLSLVFYSLKDAGTAAISTFILLGLASIAAAIMYTVGKKAYGYHGLGDVFVFIFFGITGVLGTYFLYAKALRWELLLPAISIGALSMGVLNLNNMRDIDNDRASGKITLAVRLGSHKAKVYHYLLLLSAFLCALAFAWTNHLSMMGYAFALLALWWGKQAGFIHNNTNPRALDPLLKQLAISTLLLALSLGGGIYLFQA